MTILEKIVEDLKTLPQPKLEEAARYVHELWESTKAERRADPELPPPPTSASS